MLPRDSFAKKGCAPESFTLALDLHRQGRVGEAAKLYRSIVAEGGGHAPGARINLGTILDEAGLHDQALVLYREALELRGEDPVALNNMGNTLMKLGRFAEAAESFRRALVGAPGCQEARIALGAALQREGDAQGAIACFRQALGRDPECAEAHWNLALALLISGEFREGWREYQWRWRRDSFTSPRRNFQEAPWDGSPPAGRRILVHAEQGLGDTIQFMRYLPLLSAAGATVLAECQSPALCPLLERIPGVSGVFVMGEPLPPFDLHAPLLSLPHLFGTTLETVPDRVPYLSVAPERLQTWQRRVTADGTLRVGVAWAGKPFPDPFRSCALEALAPLAGIAGVTLYSLQLGEKGEALAASSLPMVDLTPEIADFGDTAALVSQLDLVISVDTSVAHLAGGLGKPVWLLLPKAGDYRWLLEREDSPWYPSMRIFRQRRQGEWGEVVEAVVHELRALAWRFLERGALLEPLNGWRHYRCGEFLAAEARGYEAILRFAKAAQLLPGSWEPRYHLAVSLQGMGRVAEARETLEEAVSAGGDLAPVHEALGITRQMLGELEGGIASYQRALRLDPALVKSRYNLAKACQELGRFSEALSGFAEVARMAPGHADAHWNLAVLHLLTGDLPSGWREFPWRFRKSLAAPKRRWEDHPRWDGSPLGGRRILLYGEQGLGDTLQFVRYAPLVAKRGGEVTVEVQSRSLLPLVSGVAGVSSVIVEGDPAPPFDLQASLMELPGIFGTALESIPAQVPYLPLDRERGAALRPLVPRDGSFRVGLVWRGNPAHGNDANRSLPAEKLARLGGLGGVTFYSLQLGEGSEELPLPVKDLSAAIGDFSDTAALAAELDLVLTVDTSVAHLCGGLGIPVWVLIPFVPDWRWLLGRDDSPWYPTMRLFRQQQRGEWDQVLSRVRDALIEEASKGAGAALRLHKERGLSLSGKGRYPEAIREFQLALAEDPHDVTLLNNLGCALDGAGREREAVESYLRAVSLDPGFMPSHYNMGNSLRSLGRSAEAAKSYRRALSLDPELPQGWHNLALSLQDMGEWEEARRVLERAIQLRPGYLEARHNLGELHHRLGNLEEAISCFKDVLAQNYRYLPSLNALGISLQLEGKLEEAVECYQQALSLNPDYLHALNNLGYASKGLGMLDRAVACYRRVLSLDPGYADARWNLALVQLLLGEYREGWEGYESRFSKVDPIPRREFPQPIWDGSPLSGKSILLCSEQGFGDTIQFARYATLLARMGGVVLVECQTAAVAPVIATIPGVARVLVRGETLPPFDLHAPLMSLPFLCRTSLATVPAEIPYLAPEPRLVERWRERIRGEGVRVGVVWAGRKSYKDDAKRSLSLNAFAPLAGVPGVDLYSLQVGDGVDQLSSPPAGLKITDLGCGVSTFADTAAIIANLDLVISADTAAAHLAGGLGKPVWVLLPMICDWRWLLEREDSPWYLSARLFRQRRRGDWEEVLQRVAAALKAWVAGERGER